MELDKLKGKVDFSTVKYSKDELDNIFQLRIKGNIASMNKKMLMDAILMGLVTSLLVAITFYIGLRNRYVISMELVGFAVLLLIHYRIKYVLLNNVNLHAQTVNSTVEKVYKRFKAYWIAYHWFVPMLSAALSIQLCRVLNYQFDSWQLIVATVMTMIISWVITHNVVKRLYGKEYQSLQKINHRFQSDFD